MKTKKLTEQELSLLVSIRRGLHAVYSHHEHDSLQFNLLDCLALLDSFISRFSKSNS